MPQSPEQQPPDSDLPSLWQLRVFETVARLENLSRAASELLRSQPAVTLSISKLEDTFGIPLFDRTRSGTFPTEAGVALMVRSQIILARANQILIDICGTPAHLAPVIASAISRTQMRSIVALGETGSMREAAQMVDITEASLLRLARQMERNFGKILFRHNAGGLSLTPEGQQLAQRMSLLQAQVEAATEHIRSYDRPRNRTINIGVMILDPAIILSAAIREAGLLHPELHVIVTTGSYDAQLKKLNSGAIDMMIGLLKRPDYARDINEIPLYSERYRVVARRGHPLASVSDITLDDLRQYQWILPQLGSPRRLAFEQIFSAGAAPMAKIETYSLSMIRNALIESEMLTVLSLTEVLSEEKIGLLQHLDFDVAAQEHLVGITLRNGWEPSPLHADFIKCLRMAVEKILKYRGVKICN